MFLLFLIIVISYSELSPCGQPIIRYLPIMNRSQLPGENHKGFSWNSFHYCKVLLLYY